VDVSKPKRCKGGEEGGRVDRDQSVKLQKGERSCSDNSAESGSPRDHHKENHHHKLRDHSKQDYIHVRARRGQATDSHSLAERVCQSYEHYTNSLLPRPLILHFQIPEEKTVNFPLLADQTGAGDAILHG
jgi:hypothetical protein